MYESYYGLRERPFDLTPNPRYLLLTPQHREALATVRYGLSGHKGITVLTGEAGTGKTTLVTAALSSPGGGNDRVVCVSNPTLSRHEFFEFLATGFELSAQAASSKARFLIEMRAVMLDRHRAGGITALIVDEAQSLPDELLEEVRLLANLETASEKLLAVVLSGQPELAERLNHPGLTQLKQRVALRSTLSPLDLSQTAAYIANRLRIAGAVRSLFTRDAVETVHERSRGIPRSISVICDNALVTGYALEEGPVTRRTVLEVCRDLDLPPAPGDGHRRASGDAEDRSPSPESRVGRVSGSAAGGELFAYFTTRRRFSLF
jgi:type II secretory pathway predicted ATPase ExeA